MAMPSYNKKTLGGSANKSVDSQLSNNSKERRVQQMVDRIWNLWGAQEREELFQAQLQFRKQQQQQQQQQGDAHPPRCALNFHGLPRAFEHKVLPSVIRHVLIPNIVVHRCDVFVHYHSLTQELGGRSGQGGTIDPQAIQQLQVAVDWSAQKQVSAKQNHTSATAAPAPVVVRIQPYTNQEFEQERGAFLQHMHTAKDETSGKPLYIPWRAYFDEATADNIVRMWHGIQGAWDLMEQHATSTHIQYDRVAFLRADVFYTTTLDVWHLPHSSLRYPAHIYHAPPLDWFKYPKCQATTEALSSLSSPTQRFQFDVHNDHAVIPAFSPVNDRYIAGPYETVRLWATKRFEWIDEHVQSQRAGVGYGIHDERFMKYTILPRIRNQQQQQQQQHKATVLIDPHICFVRARPDESLWINDCAGGGTSRHQAQALTAHAVAMAEETLDATCVVRDLTGTTVVQAVCN